MIHPTAIIEKGAEIDDTVEVGAYAIISGTARIGSGCRIGAHAQLYGRLEIGPENSIGPAAIIGGDPQDLTFDNTLESGVRIGSGNDLRQVCVCSPWHHLLPRPQQNVAHLRTGGARTG